MLMVRLKEARYMQYLSVITATISALSSATYVAWSSPSLPKLVSDNSPTGATLTHAEASWVAASYTLGGIPGSLVSGLVVEKFGRRGTLLFSAIPLFGPWIAIVFGKSAVVLVVARFIAGIGSAFVLTAVPVYNGEVSEKDIRGKLGVSTILMMNLGSFFVLTVGPFVSYRVLAIICSIFPLLFFITFYFMPESPYYLIKKERKVSAKHNLVRLSSKTANAKMIDEHFMEIENTVENDMKNKSTLWEFLSKPEYRKSLTIMFGLKTMQQFGGTLGIVTYMQTIIGSSNSSVSAEVSSIIFGVTQILSALIAGALVDKMGRKILLITSALGCALFLTAEGVYFYLQDKLQADVTNISWLPTTSLTLYLLMNHIGIFSLPYVLLGELFATNIKGIAVSVMAFYSAVLTFLVVKLYEPIVTSWGLYTMFWIYAGVCVSGALFVFVLLPETKGKTFAEIQQRLNRDNNVQRRSNTC